MIRFVQYFSHRFGISRIQSLARPWLTYRVVWRHPEYTLRVCARIEFSAFKPVETCKRSNFDATQSKRGVARRSEERQRDDLDRQRHTQANTIFLQHAFRKWRRHQPG